MKTVKENFGIVYMATADFALPSLEALIEGGYNVQAVVTMPDKPAGRGMKLQASNIKKYAQSVGIEVLQPERLRDEAFVARLRELAPDLGIVVAFRMLPEVVWSLPRLGTINLHGSLLPRYRGAAPIHWAVMSGDEVTGVTTFQLKHELDMGDILQQAELIIPYTATTGQIHDEMKYLGARVLCQTVDDIMSGQAVARPQTALDIVPSVAPKLTKENTKIDWGRPTTDLYNFVRGLCPYPSAWTELLIPGQGKAVVLKVHAAEPLPSGAEHRGLPTGTVLITGKNSLDVVCSDGILRLLQVQPAGKRSMSAEAYLNGLR
ncbi:MAG: methionyl-tRNA formyltransferase [Porphyromonadaceae bacterium]|nr:methionyl-tRNA formyltransferase [Porphyromonadaceae bacterium]